VSPKKDIGGFPKFPGRSTTYEISGISGISRNFQSFPGISGGKCGCFFAVSGCIRLYIPPKWTIFLRRPPGFSGISGNFRKFSENVGDFPRISGGKFRGFSPVSGCNRLSTPSKWSIFPGRFPGFSGISGISGKFPKNSRISKFRKSEKFPKFPKISRDGFFSKFSIFFYNLRSVPPCTRL